MAKPIQLLAKSSKLLHSLAEKGALPISELAEELDMPRPSVYRLIDALRLVGLVSTAEDGRSQLGVEVLHLARAVLDALPEARAAQGELQRLNQVTGQTVYLCAPRDNRVACLDWVRGTRVSLLALSPGGALPVNAGATSRVVLAYSPGLLARLSGTPFEQLTPKTLTSLDSLEHDGRAIRERGYSVSNEDVTLGVSALGVPVFGPAGELSCAISLAGLTDDILGNEPEYANELMVSASRIQEALKAPL
ncbi:IclR family transcriptional regulator [Paenarthrobacter sp. TYUT067]|uniref:IclR family transcriptional regulator n=1 Tax=Paenarthrobacter sp. TYUT067 TaxID=2926245 RepID=UPI00202E3086|nr:IclR family transcriptional regulator [Paenarthrobacter sp. TYUT067]MCM0614466.1 IclR family transcriptional regulator [Paenarthrobacter sp. TYUT067]